MMTSSSVAKYQDTIETTAELLNAVTLDCFTTANCWQLELADGSQLTISIDPDIQMVVISTPFLSADQHLENTQRFTLYQALLKHIDPKAKPTIPAMDEADNILLNRYLPFSHINAHQLSTQANELIKTCEQWQATLLPNL